jgi:hypothetical protein
MTYQTGTASDPSDLLGDLATFAAANGWTVNTPASGRVFINGAVLVGVNGDADSLDGRAAVTYNAGAAWNAQTDAASVSHVCNIGAGPYTAYHFYAEMEESKPLLAAVVEVSAGVYRHFIISDLIKYGSYTGGAYTDSVYHDTTSDDTNNTASSNHRYICDTGTNRSDRGHFRCDVDGVSPNWAHVYSADSHIATVLGTGVSRFNGKWRGQTSVGYQRWNLRTPLWPLELFVNRSDSLRSPVGRVPAMRYLSLRNFTPGEMLSIGGDDWQLWPVVARTDTSGANPSSTPSSSHYGYAYLRT